jgi:hypothetical protein
MTLSYPFVCVRAPLAGGLVIVHVSKVTYKDHFQQHFLQASIDESGASGTGLRLAVNDEAMNRSREGAILRR